VQIGPLRLSQALALRVDALSNGTLALFLLAASWDRLYEAVGLPAPHPAWYAQLLGAVLVAFAGLEWMLADTPAEPAITGAAAVGSALAAAILAVWLAAGESGAETKGQIGLWSVAAFLAVATVVHVAVLVRRRGS